MTPLVLLIYALLHLTSLTTFIFIYTLSETYNLLHVSLT